MIGPATPYGVDRLVKLTGVANRVSTVWHCRPCLGRGIALGLADGELPGWCLTRVVGWPVKVLAVGDDGRGAGAAIHGTGAGVGPLGRVSVRGGEVAALLAQRAGVNVS